MWVLTDSKGLVDLSKAYYIGIQSTSKDKIWVVASFPFYNGITEKEEQIYIRCFENKEEAQACMKGINDRIGVGLH